MQFKPVYPWYGFYVLCLAGRLHDGTTYYHPVRWSPRMKELDELYFSFLNQWYRGKLDRVPVIVDYTGLRKQKLPESYNNIPEYGEQLTLEL